jgi:hypothetical protein
LVEFEVNMGFKESKMVLDNKFERWNSKSKQASNRVVSNSSQELFLQQDHRSQELAASSSAGNCLDQTRGVKIKARQLSTRGQLGRETTGGD